MVFNTLADVVNCPEIKTESIVSLGLFNMPFLYVKVVPPFEFSGSGLSKFILTIKLSSIVLLLYK